MVRGVELKLELLIANAHGTDHKEYLVVPTPILDFMHPSAHPQFKLQEFGLSRGLIAETKRVSYNLSTTSIVGGLSTSSPTCG